MSGLKYLRCALLVIGAALATAAAAPATTVTLTEGVYAKMDTTLGPMIIELYENDAPHTVQNFIELAEGKKKWKDPKTGQWQTGKPLYDGTVFHHVIKNFMAQGGDPAGTGAGDVGFTIPFEKSPRLRHDRPGVVAMARTPDPDSAASQFYITFKRADKLDNPPGYAVFGQVLHGMDTVRALEQAPTDPKSLEQSRPLQEIKIKKVTIIRVEKGQTAEVKLDDKPQTVGDAPKNTPLSPDQLRSLGLPSQGNPPGSKPKAETNYGK
ncbi:MAG: peptidylprolyl isomerase [Candidatus Sumerlaeota bacterium]|nr:peptidylprolyl isomerase [Candidatus Sumerlaeota bacterium]